MQRGIADRDNKNCFPGKFLLAIKKAVAKPMIKAINVEKKACFIVNIAIFNIWDSFENWIDGLEKAVTKGSKNAIITVVRIINANSTIDSWPAFFIFKFTISSYSERIFIIFSTAVFMSSIDAETVFEGIGAAIV